MTRDELINYIDNLTEATGRTGLLDLVLDQLRADAEHINQLTQKNAALTRDNDGLVRTLNFDRSQTERRLNDQRELHKSAQDRLRAQIDRTHRIGVRVLEAKQAGRQTVRIADVVDA